MVAGPTGCGKSRGAQSLAAHRGYRLCELDGSDPDSIPELLAWIDRTRMQRAATGQKPALLLLDDFESFPPETRRAVATHLERPPPPRVQLAPVMITCTQARDPSLRDLARFATVRLYAPSARVMRAWFGQQPYFSGAAFCDLLAQGDLRRLQREMDVLRLINPTRAGADDAWTRIDPRGAPSADDAAASASLACSNIFEQTRALLRGAGRPPVGALRRGARPGPPARARRARAEAVARRGCPPRWRPPNSRTWRARPAPWTRSRVDAMQPARFEHRSAQAALRMQYAAGAVHRRPHSVGALVPPPRLANGTGRGRSGPAADPQGRPIAGCEWIDVPASLRGSA